MSALCLVAYKKKACFGFQNTRAPPVFHNGDLGWEGSAEVEKVRNLNSKAVTELVLTSERKNTENKNGFRYPKSYSLTEE